MVGTGSYGTGNRGTDSLGGRPGRRAVCPADRRVVRPAARRLVKNGENIVWLVLPGGIRFPWQIQGRRRSRRAERGKCWKRHGQGGAAMQGGDKRTERGGRLRTAKAAERQVTYKAAGVDVDKALDIVDVIEAHAARTRRPEMLGALGGFGGMFALDRERWREPLLVAGADGVGTKLHLAFALDHHDTIGQDCVAMCVNDIVVQGAEPL